MFRRHPLAVAALLLLGAPRVGHALPQDAQVVAGQVKVGTPAGGRLGLVQSSPRAIVHWRSFDIGLGQSVSLQQPEGGVALFRVTGGQASHILGSLDATGTLFLSNPGGVYFGAGARADVGSLVATTLGITNSDFLAGRHAFAGDSRASVVNEGRIQAAPGGAVVLLGASVANTGRIDAPRGSVALGAGSAATLDVYGNGLLRLNMTAGADGARIDHGGTITADGGVAGASALGQASVLNIGGLMRAQSLEQRGGAIFLSGGDGSRLTLSGTLDAGAAPGAAGGGVIEARAQDIQVDAGARVQADAQGTGRGGHIVLVARRDMVFEGQASARGGERGGDGGDAEVSGLARLSFTGNVDLRAPAGRFGNLLLDPSSIDITFNSPFPASIVMPDSLSAALELANVTVQSGGQDVIIFIPPAGVPRFLTNSLAPEGIYIHPDAQITWSAPTTLTLRAGGEVLFLPGGASIRNTHPATGFDALVIESGAWVGPPSTTTAAIGLLPGTQLQTQGGNIVMRDVGGNVTKNQQGVLLQAGAVVQTVDGQISISGLGRGTPDSTNHGVSLAQGASIRATGAGSIRLQGTAGAGAASDGIRLDPASTVSAASGSVDLFGLAPAGGTGIVLQVGASASTSGDMTLTADALRIGQVARVRAEDTLTVRPATVSEIVLGGADAAGRLGLDATDLAGMSAGTFVVRSPLGSVSVSSPVSLAPGSGQFTIDALGRVQVDGRLFAQAARIGVRTFGDIGFGAAGSLVSLGADGATRAIELRSLNGRLDNAAGAQALNTPAGTWSVSLRSPSGQGFGGLVSGNPAAWNVPFGQPVPGAGNRYGFQIPPTVFLGQAALVKDYGDDLGATVDVTGRPLAPWVQNIDNAFTDYAGASLVGKVQAQSQALAATTPVGTYNDLRVARDPGFGTSLAGYAVQGPAALTGAVTVSPRPLVLQPRPYSRLYGDDDPALIDAQVVIGSLANGDLLRGVTPVSLAQRNSDAGRYTLSIAGVSLEIGSLANYAIDVTPLVRGLTILPRPITLAPRAQSRVYGDANPATGEATLVAGTLVGTDSFGAVTLQSPATPASDVGGYPLTGIGASFTSGTARNYAISFTTVDGGLQVTRRPLTITPDAVARPYGDANPATAGASGNNLVNGDTIAGVTLDTAATPASHVGTYATRGGDAIFSRGQAGNYLIGYADNASGLAITQRPIELLPDTVSRVYGDANPARTTARVAAGSLVNGDTVASVSLATQATAASPAGAHPTTGGDAVFGNGLASDYAITYGTNAGGLVITPRPLNITPVAVSRTYGDANPATAGATGDNLVNGDAIGSVTLRTSATPASNVGTYATSGRDAVFAHGLAGNYAIGYADNATGLAVTPRALTVTPVAVSRTYGDANPATAGASGDNLVNGDAIGSVTLRTSATPASNVGTYATSGRDAVFAHGLAGNYTIAYADNATGLAVTPRGLTVTPVAVSRTYGDANPATAAATGDNLVNGDALGSVTLRTSATPASHVGSYATSGRDAVFSNGLAGNYTIAYADHPGGLAVTPRALTLTPDALARSYGDANPARGSATADNLVNGDTVASVALATPATTGSGVGRYELGASDAVFGQGSAANYAIRYLSQGQGLTVQPRAVAVTVPAGQSKFVGQPEPALRFLLSAGSLVAGDGFTGGLQRSPGEAPGSYPIGQGSLDLGANYRIAFSGAPFTIAAPAAVPTIDRPSLPLGTPVGTPVGTAAGTAAAGGLPLSGLLAALPPPAAGGSPTTMECVLETLLDAAQTGASRIVNRGIRLPDGVVATCR